MKDETNMIDKERLTYSIAGFQFSFRKQNSIRSS